MPDMFSAWFIPKMDKIGYEQTFIHFNIESTWVNFKNGDEQFHVMYLKAPMSPEAIRQTFSSHNDPVLFVVDRHLIMPFGIESNPPMWLKILHAIYYGRIYIWNSFESDWIKALHFDWEHNRMSWSESLDLDGILFTDTDCKLRDFPGVFHIARFYDRAFWKEQESQKPKEPTWEDWFKYEREQKEKNTKAKWEDFEKRQRKKADKPPKRNTEEDIAKAFARAFEEAMRRAQASQQQTYNQTPNRYTPTGDKWLQQFIATGSLAAAKTMYRQLGKEWHPDLNPGKPQALETMQAINIAYDKVKDILR